ncbi:MAG: trypsin-like peptidase domain-containing protein [Pontiella sp.]|nr:trypsin-like peptidase domain-containing protein [Pontiella sp.]
MVFSALISGMLRRGPAPLAITVPEEHDTRFAPRQRPISGSNPARQFSDAIADAVEKVMPSVVVIRTEKVRAREQRVPLDPFGFSYGVRVVPEQLEGEGSGVIIDERGYIVTSWHVIDEARQIEVVLNDGTKLPATPVGRDTASDLAVLKIKTEAMSYPAVEFGDSDIVRVGDVSIAIGSPFSLQSSVTVGHVSQKGRRVQILPYEDFIQTDAAINEGNSGGPLIDVDGRLIGINAAIQTEAQKRGVGIAFAVPSNLAMVIAKSLIETGRHEWPWVGAFFYTVEAPFRESIFDGASVVVSQVWDGTAAERAGFQPGDLVLEVDGVKVKTKYDVDRIIFNHAVGDEVRFLVRRGKDRPSAVVLRLEEYPALTP